MPLSVLVVYDVCVVVVVGSYGHIGHIVGREQGY